jgi:hypothetical protein
MSGPKDYSPPPSYSLNVFDGQLNTIFQLQSQLSTIHEELKLCRVNNKDLNISFDCSKDLVEIEDNIITALQSIVFGYKGTFGQASYDKISADVNARIKSLDKLVKTCQGIQDEYLLKKTDYQSYLNYLELYDSAVLSFNNFKVGILDYFQKSVSKISPKIFLEAQSDIQSVNIKEHKVSFQLGFNSIAEESTNKIVNEVLVKEKEIGQIRIITSDKIIQQFPNTRLPIKKEIISKDVAAITKQILKILAACPVPEIVSKYRIDLERLEQSESLIDIHYYKQIHDSIIKSEKTRKLKLDIYNLIKNINDAPFHISLGNEQEKLIKACLLLIDKSSIDLREVSRVRELMSQLKIKSNTIKREAEIFEKERLFLKSQIVLSLENMGYEVMDDLEVIDFEKTDDLLLKTKDKSNYLNLKFKKDGSFRYVFQIPEKKESLSVDQINNKLNQMDMTCSDFRNVLSDLGKMGLKIDLRNAKPTSKEYLLSLTENQEKKVVIKKRVSKKNELKIKYLE